MTTWVKRLLAANVVIFALSQFVPILYPIFALRPQLLLQTPWSPFTYMFLHADFWHLLVNMIGLFFFGPRLEQRIGERQFLLLYLFSGLGGAVFALLPYLLAAMIPELGMLTTGAGVIGASGAVFGILLGFARFWPDEPIYIWGILPIAAKWLITALVGFSIFSGITGTQAGVSHLAHLGGFAAGWAFLVWRERRSRQPKQSDRLSHLQRIAEEVKRDARRWENIPVDELHEINRSEVNRILEKLREHGMSSLTVSERDFLNRMVKK